MDVLTDEQIETFLKDGVLVAENILTASQVESGLQGISDTLARNAGVDVSNLSKTGHGLQSLSSTNGSGGVLDLFHDGWKCEIATNPRLFRATTQLWKAAYCHQGEARDELADDDTFRWHPYGPFDCQEGFCYMDRIGYRLPTELATQLGADLQTDEIMSGTKKSKRRSVAIQRSLTPHLDCCPETFFSQEKSKWRPIQCFVSLSDTLEPNMGGFEAVPGFHRGFHRWADLRPPTKQITKTKKQVRGKRVINVEEVSFSAPCIGEYTHIRPLEDCDVMKRVQHFSVRAGSAVFFDNRIPHANAYRHDGNIPRSVVYCSFLPDVAINRPFVTQQLLKWQRGEPPNDQWVGDGTQDKEGHAQGNLDQAWLTPLARKLMSLDPW